MLYPLHCKCFSLAMARLQLLSLLYGHVLPCSSKACFLDVLKLLVFALPTVRNAYELEESTMIWMLSVKMAIIIHSLKCLEVGHLEITLR